MGDAVIVSAGRTAIGSARKGSLLSLDAFDLGKLAIEEALKRSGIPTDEIDDIVLGEVLQGGGDIARYAAIELGMIEVPGVAHNRHCASGMAAVQTAAASIKAGMDTVVIAGGTESISRSPQVFKKLPGQFGGVQQWLSPSHRETPDAPAMDMSITVGWNTAQKANVTREEQDNWAYHSHMRAIAATDEGRLKDEIFAVEVPAGKGETRIFDVDEHPRRDTTMEKLASLPALHPEIPGFSITAGNSSGLNDGSCAMVICDSEYAKAHGLKPLAIIKSWASAGVAPADTGLGPTVAIPKALSRRPRGQGHRPRRDQRGVRIDGRRFEPDPRLRSRHRERERERLQPRSPGCLHRRAHDHDAHVRARTPGRRQRGRQHVCRRRHGFGDRHRGSARLSEREAPAGERRSMAPQSVRVAAVQAAPVYLDRDATVEKAVALIDEAAALGAQLIVFGEVFVPGYPDWTWRTSPWSDAALFGRLLDQAVVVPSPATERLGDAA